MSISSRRTCPCRHVGRLVDAEQLMDRSQGIGGLEQSFGPPGQLSQVDVGPIVQAEDRLAMGRGRPQQIEAVLLDLREGLLVRDDVALLVPLRPQHADDAVPRQPAVRALEALAVQVVAFPVVLHQCAGRDPAVQLLGCLLIPPVQSAEGDAGDIVPLLLQPGLLLGGDDVVRGEMRSAMLSSLPRRGRMPRKDGSLPWEPILKG